MARKSSSYDTAEFTAPTAGVDGNGVVVRLIRDKGFGFIKADNGGEFFFHRSSTLGFDQLEEGTRVSYQQGMGPKGPRAEQVRAE